MRPAECVTHHISSSSAKTHSNSSAGGVVGVVDDRRFLGEFSGKSAAIHTKH